MATIDTVGFYVSHIFCRITKAGRVISGDYLSVPGDGIIEAEYMVEIHDRQRRHPGGYAPPCAEIS